MQLISHRQAFRCLDQWGTKQYKPISESLHFQATVKHFLSSLTHAHTHAHANTRTHTPQNCPALFIFTVTWINSCWFDSKTALIIIRPALSSRQALASNLSVQFPGGRRRTAHYRQFKRAVVLKSVGIFCSFFKTPPTSLSDHSLNRYLHIFKFYHLLQKLISPPLQYAEQWQQNRQWNSKGCYRKSFCVTTHCDRISLESLNLANLC